MIGHDEQFKKRFCLSVCCFLVVLFQPVFSQANVNDVKTKLVKFTKFGFSVELAENESIETRIKAGDHSTRVGMQLKFGQQDVAYIVLGDETPKEPTKDWDLSSHSTISERQIGGMRVKDFRVTDGQGVLVTQTTRIVFPNDGEWRRYLEATFGPLNRHQNQRIEQILSSIRAIPVTE